MTLPTLFRKVVLASVLFLSATTQAEDMLPKELIVATAVWPEFYTQVDGKGLYQKIVAQVFNTHKIDYIYTSYDISKALVDKQQAHFWIGSYPNEESFAITPTEAFDADRIVAIYSGEHEEVTLEKMLKTKSVAWQKDYDYQIYLPEFDSRYYEVPDIATGLSMLKANRISFFLTDFDDITHYLSASQLPYPQLNLHIFDYRQIELYPAFYNNQLGRALVQRWDVNLKKMKKDGSLKALYSEFDEPYILVE